MTNDLTRIFEPLTSRQDDLASIDIVAFDIFGTLIDRDKKAKPSMVLFAHYLAQKRSVDIAFISTEPGKARDALILNGLRSFAVINGVELKQAFYERCADTKKHVLAIDDDAHDAAPAFIHIDPNDDVVKKFLEEKAYRHPALFRR